MPWSAKPGLGTGLASPHLRPGLRSVRLWDGGINVDLLADGLLQAMHMSLDTDRAAAIAAARGGAR
jgi:hypothetical protein